MSINKRNNLKTGNKIAGCYIPAILSFLFLVFIDQLVKYLIDKKMELNSSIVLWKDVFEIHYIHNSGAAWGLLEDKLVLFYICTGIVFIIGVSIYIKCVQKNKFKDIRILIVLILSGAIGNFIDRIRFHYVIDFLYFKLINFPVFNIADCYVTIGFFVLIYLILFKYKDEDFENNR